MGLFSSGKKDPFKDIQENIGKLVEESEELESIDRKELGEASSDEMKQEFGEEGRSVEQLLEDIGALRKNPGSRQEFIQNLLPLLDELSNSVKMHVSVVQKKEIPAYHRYEENGDTAAANTKGQEIEGKLIVLEAMIQAALNVCQDAEAIAESHGSKKLHNAVQQKVSNFRTELESVQQIKK